MTYLMVVRVPADATPTREEGDPTAWVEARGAWSARPDAAPRLAPRGTGGARRRARTARGPGPYAMERVADRPRAGRAGRRAATGRPPGPYLLQASIAACHATAPTPEATPWAHVADLYGVLGADRTLPARPPGSRGRHRHGARAGRRACGTGRSRRRAPRAAAGGHGGPAAPPRARAGGRPRVPGSGREQRGRTAAVPRATTRRSRDDGTPHRPLIPTSGGQCRRATATPAARRPAAWAVLTRSALG